MYSLIHFNQGFDVYYFWEQLR